MMARAFAIFNTSGRIADGFAAKALSVRQCSHHRELDQNLRLAQPGFDGSACRGDPSGQPAVPDGVHAGEIGFDVLQVDGDRKDVLLVGPRDLCPPLRCK